MIVSAAQWKVSYCVYLWYALNTESLFLYEHCWTVLCSSFYVFMKDVCHVRTMFWIALFLLSVYFSLIVYVKFCAHTANQFPSGIITKLI